MAQSNGQHLSAHAIFYLIHHIVLPPKLPQEDDYDASYERLLIDTVICALQYLQDGVIDGSVKDVVASGIRTIERLRDSRDDYGNVSEHQLREVFQKLAFSTTNESVPLEIKAQNSGLLVRRCGHDIIFEPFELSPLNNAAVSSIGRLIRMFPGSASKLPIVTMQGEAFRKSLAYTIAKLTTQAASGTRPQVQKNGQTVDEDRDTTHPMMVTDWLMNYITSFGEVASLIRISKNTREETLWSNCKHPWRRSPLWLLVRVTLQLLFTRRGSLEEPLDGLYKAFVAQFLSQILDSAKKNWRSIGSETLHIIYAKLARRFRKMDNLGQLGVLRPKWTTDIKTSMVDAHNLIKQHWVALSDGPRAIADTAQLRNLRPDHDLNVALPELDTFLAAVAVRRQITDCTEFKPSAEYPTFPAGELPTTFDASGQYKYIRLAAFETWIEHHLPLWSSTHLLHQDTCGSLRNLIQNYHSVASIAYTGLPYSISIMYLTLLELWVACDSSACRLYPLLSQYGPEINLDECQCLVLLLKSQMERLVEVERYVQARQDAAAKANTSVFHNFGGSSSFAVKYFDQSLELQDVLINIERDAMDKKRRKLEELAGLKRRYKDLMERYNSGYCETHEVVVNHYHGYTETKHKPNCVRCNLKKTADGLDIHIYEWPLSSDRLTAKATVFELQIPHAFSDWRDASMYLIASVLGCRDELSTKPEFKYTLDNHHGLSYLLSSWYHGRRVIPLSSIKSHTNTHRKRKQAIPNIQDGDICLPSALRYAYFDKTLGIYTGNCVSTENVAHKCMHRMPNNHSKALERFLYRPPSAPDGLSPNEVIASLFDCPKHFSVDEYKAFGMLPLGRNILYSNILAQLATPTIDFSKAETHTLLLQIVGQVGISDSNGNPRRVSHRVLAETSFGLAMLGQLAIALRRVAENWESWRAPTSFVALAKRILSLTLSQEVQQISLRFLDEARRVSMKWLNCLKRRATTSMDEKQRNNLYSRATEVALLCASTFDVDDKFIDVVLQQQSAISILLQCSITIQENHNSVQSESQNIYNSMLQSWRSFLYRAFTKLRQHLLHGNTGLNDAVLANWTAFRPATKVCWKMLSYEYEHWLYTKSGSLTVYFNLLTGELLVNGLPLARLPSEFIQHPMYMPLFKNSTLEVVPTDMPGMRFSAKSTYRDYELHFGMGGTDMYVVAIKDHCTLDLLPSCLFENRLPFSFVENYIHWYDRNHDKVIFRPRGDPWSSEDEEWRLVGEGTAWRLFNGVNVLTSMTSDTARTLSKIFRSLDGKQHIHTVLDTTTQSVLISLPRLKLDFFLEQGDLKIQSRQYRSMVVDPDQTMGVLVGLSSKLVLKSENQSQDRLVIIPVPQSYDPFAVTYMQASNQHHVSVTINKDNACGVYTYSLDTTLGRVLDSGNVQGKLFLAFLHAITSHCLPDPLTGHTGTESALQILQSAAVRSFEFLTADNIELLGQIAALSPVRAFYPPNLMEMQQIEWDQNLPILSQHPQLRIYAKEIIHQAQKMSLFYPRNIPDISNWKSSNSHLEAREAIRSSTFRIWNFGGGLFTSKKDAVYNARDVHLQSERGRRSYIAASLIVRDQAALHTQISNLKDKLLRTHFRAATIQGGNASFHPVTLRFDSKWLADASTTLKEHWCHLHRTLPALSANCNKFDIAAWLSTMAFATTADLDAIQTLAVFYRLQGSASISPPSASFFNLPHGDTCNATEIRTIARTHSKKFNGSTEARLPKEGSESTKQHKKRLRALFQSRQDGAVEVFVAALQQQWPTADPVRPTLLEINAYIKVPAVMQDVMGKFQSWYRNQRFMVYLQQLSAVIAQQDVIAISPPRYIAFAPLEQRIMNDALKIFGIDNVFAAVPPVVSRENATQCSTSTLSPPYEPKSTIQEQDASADSRQKKSRLEQFCKSLQGHAESTWKKKYVVDLLASCASLKNLHGKNFEASSTWSNNIPQDVLQQYLDDCNKYFERLGLALAQVATSNGSLSDEVGLNIQHSPRISPTFWLSQLHRDRFATLSEAWKTAMIEYGLAITQLQRAQRLIAVSSRPADLIEELRHIGHSNWQPRDFPETLLLEAESGILIRHEQEFIASHMREPNDLHNIVLQLLMGGGKSSTIVPILVAYLTDKEKLVRVIVAKPQSKQMLRMLVAKLGYLLNRRVYHMPFSRDLRPSTSEASLIREIYEECIANRGVLLIQPENILSFKLMAVESALTKQPCARSLLDTQRFFDSVSRDIVDESDENFSVKFELIYTMGSQRLIEFAPERWHVIQAVVGLVPRFAAQAKEKFPDSIEIQGDDDGRFPRIRLLRKDAADQLFTLIAKHVVEFGVIGLPTSSQPPDIQAALLQYITESEPTAEVVRLVESSMFWTPDTKSPLLVVRGLIAGGILGFALSTKRWRVNFGLDPSRIPETQLAVPFRSKDSPSPRSEFSHPDVVILLSLLSYYYGGLTNEQLFDSFVHLQKSDQAAIQYDEWVSTASPRLPAAFRQLSGVSIKDQHQCLVEIFPSLCYSKQAIDYYLSFLVFPKAMKEFPQKLSASGWDIGAIKKNPLTGFSGTNDTLHLLPLTVQHLDLPSQSHTNALVLQYLLEDENSVELLPPRTSGTDAEHILSVIVGMEPEVRVILDCGASILEQNNRQVAESWLKMRDKAIQAVVFFDDEELSVLDQAGRIESFQTSPFAKQLDVCLVYLDEAHTRGTDLKLPRNYRAGVTLGQALTKDKLTQGCMRMRKLGFGQSVAFIVPEEILTKIRDRTHKTSGAPIGVDDVLCWSIGETWQDLKRSMPLWAVQGERFERTKDLLCGTRTNLEQANAFLENEAQTLKARYKPLSQEDSSMELVRKWDMTNSNIAKIVTRFQEFGAMGFVAATLSEEQERELAPEIEEERQIQRPPRLDAEIHRVHTEVRRLVRTGEFLVNSEAFQPAFQALAMTSAAKLFELTTFPTDLLVTTDFMRTVKIPPSSTMAPFISDSYQRPVQFILSVPNATNSKDRTLVIISPFEANQLLDVILKEVKVTLHLFSPRANASYAPLDRLLLYNVGLGFLADQISRSLTVQLNLFAGSLYLRSFEEYSEICDFLGLLRCKPKEGQQAYADGFMDPPVSRWGLVSSPVPFLRSLLMKIRREGQGVEKTHLGRVLNGVRLERNDFDGGIELAFGALEIAN